MKNHKIVGGGGIQLHLVETDNAETGNAETGNSSGRPILFIHGFSQCWRTWDRQMNSDLANDHRLVAMDMRGHGLSDKPRDAYADSKLWADDVNAAIQTLKLDHPVLCGWSYGPLVILDYIRHYGEDNISGVAFVGAITKLGSEAAASMLTPEFLSLVPGFFATKEEKSRPNLDSLLHQSYAQQPSAEVFGQMLKTAFSVLAYLRQGMFSRSFDNDDLLPRMRKPVLIAHGAKDAIVKPAIVDQHKAGLAHAQIQVMTNAGHAAFWDDAPEFNRHLRGFSTGV